MSDTKFTPGPWREIPSNGIITIEAIGMYDVAIVRTIGKEDNEANARLIAAAPDLYAALKDLLAYVEDGYGDDDDESNEWTPAHKALKKARGE